MPMTLKAPHINWPFDSATGLYATVVPLILAGLSLALFGVTALLLEVWTSGWTGTALLLLLSVETFFLPYILLPLAVWLPTLLPWVTYDRKQQFGIDGPGRLAQRILVAVMILLPGLPVLAAFDATVGALAGDSILASLIIMARAGLGTLAVFAVLTVILMIPDLGSAPEEN